VSVLVKYWRRLDCLLNCPVVKTPTRVFSVQRRFSRIQVHWIFHTIQVLWNSANTPCSLSYSKLHCNFFYICLHGCHPPPPDSGAIIVKVSLRPVHTSVKSSGHFILIEVRVSTQTTVPRQLAIQVLKVNFYQ
jgi:hypothetical protein